jgi:hypothetical protein
MENILNFFRKKHLSYEEAKKEDAVFSVNSHKLISHSVIIIDKDANRRVQELQFNLATMNINSLPLSKFGNEIVIKSIMRDNNIEEKVDTIFDQHKASFKSQNFMFNLELKRFGIWQTGSFGAFMCCKLAKSLINLDTDNKTKNIIEKIGINYEYSLSFAESEMEEKLKLLLSDKANNVDEKFTAKPLLATPRMFNSSYWLNDNFVANISIFKSAENKYIFSFNAENIIDSKNNIDDVLNKDHYDTCQLFLEKLFT